MWLRLRPRKELRMVDRNKPPLVKGGQGRSDEEVYGTGVRLLQIIALLSGLALFLWVVG
jgi:hypothetical protein|tara:strand:+ start:18002 stop:18178 length:177 start_codon:yes stop_codon:yes gene_type:complete